MTKISCLFHIIILFSAIHEYFGDEVVSSLIDHNSQHCLVCNANMLEENSNEASPVKVKNNNSDLLGKIGLAMKLKSQEVKGKLFDYIVNPTANVNSNIEKRDSRDLDYIRRQKKTAPVFSIDDDQEIGNCSLQIVLNLISNCL